LHRRGSYAETHRKTRRGVGGETKTMNEVKKYKQLFRLERKKIPTSTEFLLCPLCGEPLVFQWEDEILRGFRICRNPNCEIQAIEIKEVKSVGERKKP
jgi:hypothetical protein